MRQRCEHALSTPREGSIYLAGGYKHYRQDAMEAPLGAPPVCPLL